MLKMTPFQIILKELMFTVTYVILSGIYKIFNAAVKFSVLPGGANKNAIHPLPS